MESKEKIKLGISAVVLSTLVSLLIYIVPTLHIFMFFIGVPIIVVGYLTDFKFQIIISLIITVLVSLLDITYGMSILLTIIFISLVETKFIKEKTSKAVLFGSIAGVFGTIVSIYLINYIYNIDIIDNISKIFDAQIQQTQNLSTTLEGVSESDIIGIVALLKSTKETFMLSIPSIIIIESIITSALTIVISKRILIKRKYNLKLGEFKDFRIGSENKYVILTVIFIIGALALIDKNNSEFYLTNTMIVLSFIFSLNGFSYILYRVDKKKKKGLKVLVTIIFILSFIISPISLFIGIIGVADLFVNLREIRRSNEK